MKLQFFQKNNWLVKPFFLFYFVASFLFAQKANAQTPNPCETFEADIVIPAISNIGYTLPNPAVGLDIEIQGNLQLSSDFRFENCNIRFRTTGKITVPSNIRLTIENSELFACAPEMWDGIHVQSQSILVMRNSTVQDAYNGIFSKGYSRLYLSNNDFFSNVVGINCEPAPGLQTSTPLFGQFESNRFSATFQPPFLNDGTSRATTGIRLFKINTSLGGGLQNTFTQLPTGIYIEGSTANIYRCQFIENRIGLHTIKSRVSQKGLGNNAFLPTFRQCGYGIRASGSTLVARESYYENNTIVSIRMEGQSDISDVEIYDNGFYNDNQVGLEPMADLTFHSQISFDTDNDATINFTKVRSISIHDNIFSVNTPTVSMSSIVIYNIRVSKNYDIYDNNFTYEAGFELGEIRGEMTVAPFRLVDNNVLTRGTSSGIFHLHGFSAPNSEVVNCNVTGTIPSPVGGYFGASQHVAFRSEVSHLNWCNNSVENMPNGLKFYGDCDTSYISEHQTGANVGIGLFIESGARIGPQDLRGNTWPSSPAYRNARCNGDPLLSYFWADFSLPGHNPINPIPATDWFENKSGNEGCMPTSGLGGLKGNVKTLLEGGITDANTDALTIWQIRRTLVDLLGTHPEWQINNSPAANFYSEYNNHRIGQFAIARRTLRSALKLSASQDQMLDSYHSNMLTHLETMESMESLLAQYPENSNYLNTWLQASSNLVLNGNECALLEESINSTQQTALLGALALYNQIIPVEIWEQNEKNLYVLLLQQMTNTSTQNKEVQVNMIRSIAAQCSRLGGETVDFARSLLPAAEFKAYLLMAEEPSCPKGTERGALTGAVVYNFINITPNPANNLLQIQYSDTPISGTLTVTDITGRVILVEKLDGRNATIQTGAWANGVYYAVFTAADGQRQTNKLVIQH
jgi:hypothetical protein